MSAPPPHPKRRRRRRGSPERPVNAALYRSAALFLALPLLLAAFTVGRPGPLPAPPLPPAFDARSALELSRELARLHPDRSPGTTGSARAALWLRAQLASYGFRAHSDRFRADIAGIGRVPLENVSAVVPGRSPSAIVVLAHRDNTGAAPGANDNASGTAALLELARPYANFPGTTQRPTPAHTLLFVSTDGGAYGAVGAERFAASSPYRPRVLAAINLDAIAGEAAPRIAIAGDEPRSPTAALVRTIATRIAEQTGAEPRRPAAIAQLIDLAFPFSLYEQAPFVGRGIPAVTITTGGDRAAPSFDDTASSLEPRRLAQLGRAARAALDSLDGGLELAPTTGSYVYLGPLIVRGWAIEIVLIAALLPFFVVAVDLFARCRRRGISLAPAARSLRSRLAFWLYVGVLFALGALAGLWPGGAARPLVPDAAAAGRWPLLALAVFGVAVCSGWLVARERLLPRRIARLEDELAGHTVALLALGVVALLVVATNPFALIFVLPSLHAWIWLPQLRLAPRSLRAVVLAAGLTGPFLLLASFANRYELGLDTPWYLAALAAVGYVSPASVAIALAWAAAAGQLFALTAGRYAPYPSAAERPARGPLRELVRRAVLVTRRRRASDPERRALEG